MEHTNFIAAKDLCTVYGMDYNFIIAIKEAGLLEFKEENQDLFVEENLLENFDKLWRLHYEMEINVEGMETINHLLHQLHLLQIELKSAQAKIQFYEKVVNNS